MTFIPNDILVAGDIHGRWSYVSILINKKKPIIILQTGDWGWWPNFHNTRALDTGEFTGDLRRKPKWNLYGIKNKDTKIYFCDGNHENHWALRDIISHPCHGDPPRMGQDGIYYMRRSSTLKLPDGRVVMFFGGADSIDKKSRILGRDWFPEEIIMQGDLYELPLTKVDIVISHTCPVEFLEHLETYKILEPSNSALSYILHRFKPDLWYFGHYHQYKRGKYLNTNWCTLNEAPESFWWVKLD